MAKNEHEAYSPTPNGKEKRDEGVAIMATPIDEENLKVSKTPEGGYTIFLRGEIKIAIRPPQQAAPDVSPNLSPKPLDGEISTGNGQTNGLVPDNAPSALSEPLSAAETVSETPSPTPSPNEPDLSAEESENRKFELVGNPVFDPFYKARKSGKRIADFALATHPDKQTTKYWRIRAFDDLAERVRDTVRKGQTGIEVVAYGPKYWQQKKKTKEGDWTQETVKGYYAGMVRVPRRYRQQEEAQEKKEDKE